VSAAGAPVAVLDDVWVSFRRRSRRSRAVHGPERWALRGINLTVAPGDCIGVVGANGSGKSTLLNTLAGVIRPTRGDVWVRGRVASLVELSAGFHRDLTGHENLVIGGALMGYPPEELRDRLPDILAFSGLAHDVLDQPLATYSAGQGIRLAFALVAHLGAKVLLVDEVLAVGDADFQQRCLDRVDEMRAQGCGVVIVSHDLEVVARHCTRVAVLRAGAVDTIAAPDVALARHLEVVGLDPGEDDPDAPLMASVAASRRRSMRERRMGR
jgi:ABC-type polysaccharide/polyol phosphate transport system ATPase subunit